MPIIGAPVAVVLTDSLPHSPVDSPFCCGVMCAIYLHMCSTIAQFQSYPSDHPGKSVVKIRVDCVWISSHSAEGITVSRSSALFRQIDADAMYLLQPISLSFRDLNLPLILSMNDILIARRR